MTPPKVREYKQTSFKLIARTKNGETIDLRVEGSVEGKKLGPLGRLQMTPDQWRAFSVMLAFAEVKVGAALQVSIEMDADEFVKQVL